MLERIHLAHTLLHEIENIRHRITIIGTIVNPHLTVEYESDLMNRLIETEMLLEEIKERLFKKDAIPPFSPRCFRRGLMRSLLRSDIIPIGAPFNNSYISCMENL